MDLKQLSDRLAVAAQISTTDLQALADAGFRVLIDNRPDSEVGSAEESGAMRAAAQAAGLEFHYIPFEPGVITPEMVQLFTEATSSAAPTVAYCRSGNRSSILWALSQAGKLGENEILARAAEAGYDLTQIRPLIASLAARAG